MQIHRIPPGNPTPRKNITIAENRRRNGSRGVQAVGGSLANPLVKQTRYRKTPCLFYLQIASAPTGPNPSASVPVPYTTTHQYFFKKIPIYWQEYAPSTMRSLPVVYPDASEAR